MHYIHLLDDLKQKCNEIGDMHSHKTIYRSPNWHVRYFGFPNINILGIYNHPNNSTNKIYCLCLTMSSSFKPKSKLANPRSMKTCSKTNAFSPRDSRLGCLPNRSFCLRHRVHHPKWTQQQMASGKNCRKFCLKKRCVFGNANLTNLTL